MRSHTRENERIDRLQVSRNCHELVFNPEQLQRIAYAVKVSRSVVDDTCDHAAERVSGRGCCQLTRVDWMASHRDRLIRMEVTR